MILTWRSELPVATVNSLDACLLSEEKQIATELLGVVAERRVEHMRHRGLARAEILDNLDVLKLHRILRVDRV